MGAREYGSFFEFGLVIAGERYVGDVVEVANAVDVTCIWLSCTAAGLCIADEGDGAVEGIGETVGLTVDDDNDKFPCNGSGGNVQPKGSMDDEGNIDE